MSGAGPLLPDEIYLTPPPDISPEIKYLCRSGWERYEAEEDLERSQDPDTLNTQGAEWYETHNTFIYEDVDHASWVYPNDIYLEGAIVKRHARRHKAALTIKRGVEIVAGRLKLGRKRSENILRDGSDSK
ncbi:hypothetical protein ABW20_dc0102774 [Dactylellina cionopaga]|nr:hypothetical protein ABW20_dc0102774 [Dactylellina cionopaga]